MPESAKEGWGGLSEGSDIGLGCGSRAFESRHSDQKTQDMNIHVLRFSCKRQN